MELTRRQRSDLVDYLCQAQEELAEILKLNVTESNQVYIYLLKNKIDLIKDTLTDNEMCL